MDCKNVIDGREALEIFVNVTHQTEELSPADLAAWEARFELHLVGEAVSWF